MALAALLSFWIATLLAYRDRRKFLKKKYDPLLQVIVLISGWEIYIADQRKKRRGWRFFFENPEGLTFVGSA
jgi:hypothetical protein